jgi:hypothetical protein
VGAADRRASGGGDHCFGHRGSSLGGWAQRGSKRIPPSSLTTWPLM